MSTSLKTYKVKVYVFSPLYLRIQKITEQTLERQLAGKQKQDIQGAAITAVGSGEVLALVSDKKPNLKGFNRAVDAKRQIGSLSKPFVYLAALQYGYQLSSLLDDSEISVPLSNNKSWKPKNFSGESHGQIPFYKALAHSYNQSTARLGMDIGLDAVYQTMQKAGLNTHVVNPLIVTRPSSKPTRSQPNVSYSGCRWRIHSSTRYSLCTK